MDYFPYIGNVIIPTDFHIFQRGRAQPPTRYIYIYIYIYHLLLGTGWPRHGHMHIIQIMQQASGQRPEINHQVVKTTSDSDQNSCSFRFQWSFSWPLPLQLDFKHIDIGITWPLCVAHFDLSLLGCRNQMMEAVGYCRFDASPLPGKSLNNAQRANSLKSRCFLIGGILRGRNIRHGKVEVIGFN